MRNETVATARLDDLLVGCRVSGLRFDGPMLLFDRLPPACGVLAIDAVLNLQFGWQLQPRNLIPRDRHHAIGPRSARLRGPTPAWVT